MWIHRILKLEIACCVVLAVLLLTNTVSAFALTYPAATSASWASPVGPTLRSLGTLPATGEPRLAFEDNLDCLKATYRLNGTGVSQAGCFASTAFGSLDVENELLSFADNDDTVVPLIPYGPHEILLGWPGTSAMLAINPYSGDGAYLSLYRDALRVSEDQHNLLGQVVAKKLTKPADFPLLDASGRKQIVNFNSLAFSDNGAWLVVESMSGLFYRINLASLQARPFAPAFANLGAGYNQSQVAVSSSGDYIAIANSAARSLQVYDLSACNGLSTDSTICPSYDYWPFLAAKVAAWQHPVHVRFLNDNVLSFTNIVASGQTTYELAPYTTGFALMDYLALGDSFTSGEGAFAYKSGTDTENNRCHSSRRAYPLLLTENLFAKTSGNSVACSGARISDIVTNPDYRGQVVDGNALNVRPKVEVQTYLSQYTPGYLPQSSFVKHYQPGVITVSVGGNDIGFGNILKLCVAPHLNPHVTNANACYNSYEDRLELAQIIDSQVSRFTRLFQSLHRASPGSRIYAIGYPLIAVDTGSCAVNVHLNTGELALSIEVTKQLNNAMATAAKAANINFVNIENALAGHRLCEVRSDLVAVNGITAGNDGGIAVSLAGHPLAVDFLGKESFHPNAYGQELIEQAISRQTNRLRLDLSKPPLSLPALSPTSPILKAPKSGRPSIRKLPATLSPNRSVKRGTKLPIKISGSDHGLKNLRPFTAKLRGQGKVFQIGTITSDADGNIIAELPIGTIPNTGSFELEITGDDQLGNPVSMIDVITIYDSDTDYDGDGVGNAVDGCPTIFNSGVDEDGDRVDDACDGFIGLSGSTLNPPSTIAVPRGSTGTPFSSSSSVMPAAQPQSVTATNMPIRKSLYNPIVSPGSLQPASTPQVISRTTTSSAIPLSPTSTVIRTTRPPVAIKYPPLQRRPWTWFALIYLLSFLVLRITKKAQSKMT